MEEKLRAGVTLVVDRYSYSGVAFTAAKQKPGLDLEWCKAPEKGLPRPDTLLYLNLPIDEAMKRGGFGEERYETLELQKAVRANFDAMREDWWNVIDASQSMDVVQEEARAIAQAAVERCRLGADLVPLWD